MTRAKVTAGQRAGLYCAEIDGVVLLLGGHKDSQSKDIKSAIQQLEGVKSGKTRIKEYE